MSSGIGIVLTCGVQILCASSAMDEPKHSYPNRQDNLGLLAPASAIVCATKTHRKCGLRPRLLRGHADIVEFP